MEELKFEPAKSASAATTTSVVSVASSSSVVNSNKSPSSSPISTKTKMGMFHNPKFRLLLMLSMTFFFFLVEIIVGYFTNSTALIADSFHMLSDVVALLIAYVSVRMSPKKWSKNTFGWARAEVLGALINAVFLLALCFSIMIESFKRFVDPEMLHKPLLVLAVGVIGLIVNLIGLCLFAEHGHSHGGSGGHGHSHSNNQHMHVPTHDQDLVVSNDKTAIVLKNGSSEKEEKKQIVANNVPTAAQSKPPTRNMNMHGVFLHVMADALGSVIVIISALIVQYTDWGFKIYVDPGLSVIIVVIITYSTLPLLVDSALILLQTVPTHIQIDSLQRKLLEEIDGVIAVHEFHVWQLAGDRIIASAHIRCRNLHDYMQIAEKVKEFFHNEGIHSTTIQPEFVEFDEHDRLDDISASRTAIDGIDQNNQAIRNRWKNCALDCPPGPGNDCVQNTCCGPQQGGGSNVSTTTNSTSGRSSPGAAEMDEMVDSVASRRNRRFSSNHPKTISLAASSSAAAIINDPDQLNSVKILGGSVGAGAAASGSGTASSHISVALADNTLIAAKLSNKSKNINCSNSSINSSNSSINHSSSAVSSTHSGSNEKLNPNSNLSKNNQHLDV